MVIKNQTALLYKLALALECLVEVPLSDGNPYRPTPTSEPLTLLQKLQKLRRQSLAWRGELPPAQQVGFPITRDHPVYVLNSGILAFGNPFYGESWYYVRGYIPGSSPGPQHIPPSLCDVSPRVFTTQNCIFLNRKGDTKFSIGSREASFCYRG